MQITIHKNYGNDIILNNDLLAYFDINKPKIVIPEKDLVKFKKWYVSYLQTRKQKNEKII